jgi:hypothetical protein
MSTQQENVNAVTFLATNGVSQMGKRTRLIRVKEDQWDEVEPFLHKPTFVTLRRVEMPN